MIVSFVGLALAAQIAGSTSSPRSALPPFERVQYGVPAHPPPCGIGWDLSARDGLCYPNGYLPPREQAARRGYYGRRYPVRCGPGADLDIRDGRCYPNGAVPLQFQNRPQNYRY
jgi:hypothetical protein